MTLEKVYKYRSGDNSTRVGQTKTDFERDLETIERNSIYASDIASLNDPFEALVNSNSLKIETNLVQRFLGGDSSKLDVFHQEIDNFIANLNDKVGIYSLASRYNSSMLWSTYANSHKGFCIEYDLATLLEPFSDEDQYAFQVSYIDNPPELSINDFGKGKSKKLIQKITGNKSKDWAAEDEFRLVYNKPGLRHYLPRALKAIYFGLRMPENYRKQIMERLANRDIEYYEIVRNDNTFEFERRKVANQSNVEFKYLQEFPEKYTGFRKVSFSIEKIEYHHANKKGIVETTLERQVSEDALRWLAQEFKKNLFSEADRLFILNRLKGEDNDGPCWANSDVILGETKIRINDW